MKRKRGRLTPQRCATCSHLVLGSAAPSCRHLAPPVAHGSPVPLGRIPTFQLFPDFTSVSPFLIGMLGLLHSRLGEEQLVSVAGLVPDVITSGSATLHIFSGLKWRDRERQIRSAALGDGIVSNKPCMTQSFHFKWGMKLLHPLTACSMKEIYLHLIALDPKRLCTVISRR